jgi:hypothetical protein
MTQGERGCVRDACLESFQQSLDEPLLPAKTGEESKVGVPRRSGFTPAQQGQSADETESPRLLIAEFLQVCGATDDVVHAGIRARENQSCCSINPEVRPGLKGSLEKSIGMQSPWIDKKASAARSSARLMRSSSGPAVCHVATHRAANVAFPVSSPDERGGVECMPPACRIER